MPYTKEQYLNAIVKVAHAINESPLKVAQAIGAIPPEAAGMMPPGGPGGMMPPGGPGMMPPGGPGGMPPGGPGGMMPPGGPGGMPPEMMGPPQLDPLLEQLLAVFGNTPPGTFSALVEMSAEQLVQLAKSGQVPPEMIHLILYLRQGGMLAPDEAPDEAPAAE